MNERSELANYLDKFFQTYETGKWDFLDLEDIYELGLAVGNKSEPAKEALSTVLAWKTGDKSESEMIGALKKVREGLTV